MRDLPDNNPKTRHGAVKPTFHAIPPTALVHLGAAMRHGSDKYGLMNWREHDVAASVYYNAALRHLFAWWEGEREAADSGVHHLAHVMACMAILLDAEECDVLIDDRSDLLGMFGEMVEEFVRSRSPEGGDILPNEYTGTTGPPVEFDTRPPFDVRSVSDIAGIKVTS